MYLVGLPFTADALSRTRTGGSPYGASHLSSLKSTARVQLSDDERELAQLLGRRVAELAVAVAAQRA
jgi:NAD(P)H dehydrogenase (quinone)